MDEKSTRGKPFAIRRWLAAGLDWVLPHRCAGCGQTGVVWCLACNARLRKASRGCRRCGFPLEGGICRFCSAGVDRIQVRSYARYAPPLTRAILQLKYRPNSELASLMAGWLVELARREGWRPEVVVSVPLAKRRGRVRGYNQVDLIARRFAEGMKVRFEPSALARIRETASQVGLDSQARFTNVSGVFQAEAALVRGLDILVIDDLLTTGATMLACGLALLDAGAAGVFGLTVGRTHHASQV